MMVVVERYGRELQFAWDCARDLGELALSIREKNMTVGRKADRSLVTSADTEANAEFIRRVAKRYPRDGVIGEEASRPSDGSRTWVIDPVDGTTEFLRRIPVWMVAIALVEDGVARVGVAYNPSTEEMYWAMEDGPAHRGNTEIRVSARDGLGEDLLICGVGHNMRGASLGATVISGKLEPRLELTEYGGIPAVFAACKVAEGTFDGLLYPYDGAHDVAATSLIIARAGGQFTNRMGDPERVDRPVDGGVGSNGLIHRQLVEAWAKHGPR